jgi:hypothetical protein
MKEFLKKIALFALPLILLCCFLDKILNQVKRSVAHAQGEYPVWNDLYDGKSNSQIIVHGSSRALAHIDPQLLSDSLNMSAYNLGVDGHNFWLQELRQNILLKEGEKPKLILHSLDMFTLEKRNDLYNPDQFLPYLLYNNEMWQAIKDYKGYTLPDHILPLVRYYGKTEAIMKSLKCLLLGPESNVSKRIKGYEPKDRAWNDDLKKARQKMKGYRVKLHGESFDAFENYLEDCEKSQIKVVFVYSPEYYEGHDFVTNRDSIMDLYRTIANRHNVPFLDYSKDSMCLDKRWFYNSSHLNKSGATLFTQKLVRDLKKHTN